MRPDDHAGTDGQGTDDAVLALDIGGTKLAAGVVRADGTVLSYDTCPTGVADGAWAGLERLLELGRGVLAAAESESVRLLGTGIGCGGPLDSSEGTLIAPPHLPGWRDVPVTRLAEEAYGLPAVLDNDGTAGAAGQWRFGAGRGTRHLLYLTVSTGIGGGMVIDGRTYRGAAGNGGEPGHVTVRPDGRRCAGCGRAGCLEAYASGTSIAERAREAVARAHREGEPTLLGEADPLTAEDVAAAAREGDPLARRVWDETTDALSSGLTTIVNLYEPELVVLGGGVTRSADLLLPPVRENVARLAMGPAAGAARVVTAAGEERAGVLGAAAIGFERLPAPGARPEDGTLAPSSKAPA
ncbi:glucokinase [Streptomyces sp. WMMB 714]|uniref:ROK family protein n=1 Tax=Streptomyces sp. WMMB 714 TaxID=1286822 RepID=UPI0005F8001D|nr:ROK family protein [Streptomyces sp. WMMB 714]SCK32366.1 glucokinase [Streptomyces sp. WMMB 714]